jgi:hypothetical protein
VEAAYRIHRLKNTEGTITTIATAAMGGGITEAHRPKCARLVIHEPHDTEAVPDTDSTRVVVSLSAVQCEQSAPLTPYH